MIRLPYGNHAHRRLCGVNAADFSFRRRFTVADTGNGSGGQPPVRERRPRAADEVPGKTAVSDVAQDDFAIHV